MREFHLTLTDEEKRFCKELARYAIACGLGRVPFISAFFNPVSCFTKSSSLTRFDSVDTVSVS